MEHPWRLSAVSIVRKNGQVPYDATDLDAWASDDEDVHNVVNGMRHTGAASYPTNCQAQAMQVLECAF